MFEGGPVGYISSGTMVPYWKVADIGIVGFNVGGRLAGSGVFV